MIPLDLVIKTVDSKDTGLMKESSGMMIVDIRRPSQCDRAPDSWQLTGPRRQHAGCQHNTNQHPAAGTAPGPGHWTLSPSPPRLARQTPGHICHGSSWSPDPAPDCHPSYPVQCSPIFTLSSFHTIFLEGALKLGLAKIFFSRFCSNMRFQLILRTLWYQCSSMSQLENTSCHWPITRDTLCNGARANC